MTNEDIRTAFITSAQSMMAQANRDVGPRVNANESIVASRLKDFVRMNPPIFLGSRVGDDPQEFLDEVYKIVNVIGAFISGSYRMGGFKEVYLGRYFPCEKRECKAEEFINLKQEESKHKRKGGELKRGRFDEQVLPRFRKKDPNQDYSSAPKAYEEKGGGPLFSKLLCTTFEKRHHGKFLAGTSGCYGCGKHDHQVRSCPTLTARGWEGNQTPYVGPDPNAPTKNRFDALQANEGKRANLDEGTGKLMVPYDCECVL
ncbi:uncharacterized protein LOC125869816 [Solanum stenotomum]|uniref:uncharacterized protein LOC125869816 n=1 Tax=Solanum stenotomum TaxID=172797 RepID=UPI0020D18F63|nr:uncharacterized protein LOC125869816 [Solanum stenotomum]